MLATMTFDPTDSEVAMIMECLYNAADRGVLVTLIVDAHTFLIKTHLSPGPLWYMKEMPDQLPKIFHQRMQALKKLADKPTGEIAIINKPSYPLQIPVAGRSHIKLAIVNDTIFLGGCNLSDQHVDMMTEWKNAKTAEYLSNFLHEIVNQRNVSKVLEKKDVSKRLDETTTLYIDSGIRRQSIILDTALKLIDEAEKWVFFTCQFFPNSVTAEALLRAHKRGVKVEIIFSNPRAHGRVSSLGHQLSMLRERARLPQEFFSGMLAKHETYVHAKLLATDKGTMLGSHNYVRAGVILGTAEIALLSRDPDFTAQSLVTFERARAT